MSYKNKRFGPLTFILFLIALCPLAWNAAAQDDPADSPETATSSEPAERVPLSEEQTAELDETIASISLSRTEVEKLEQRVLDETGIMRNVLEKRIDDLLVSTIESALAFANKVADLREEGFDIGGYRDKAVQILETLPPAIERSAERIRDRVELPDFSKSATEQAAVDEQFFNAIRKYNQVNVALLETAKVAEQFNIDVGDLEARVREHIQNSTVNSSVFLDLAITEVNMVRASLDVKPEDEELIALLKVAESRVQDTAIILESNIGVLEQLDLPATQYKQQVLTATGALTTSALDVSVVIEVVRQWGADVYDAILNRGPDVIFQGLIFLLIVWVFFKLAKLVQRAVDKALNMNRQHLSQLLRQMISATSRNLVILLGVLIALAQFGISVGPLLAGLGIAGFILGFALQDSLSNFASGMMILFYRPFDVGDTVEVAGASGKVIHMSLVNTTIRTFDNQSLIIPNNKIWQDVITNYTDQTERRVDMEFGITYDEDIDRIEALMQEVLSSDERVLKDPEPTIKVGSFGDSSVNILCRPWVKTEDYWEVLWDLNKKIKQAFDREGVVIPFPQRDIHVFEEHARSDKDSASGEASQSDKDSQPDNDTQPDNKSRAEED